MMTNCSGCVYNKGYCSLPRMLECPVNEKNDIMTREEMKTTLTLGDIGTITIPRNREAQQWLYSLIESFVWRKEYPYSKTQILKYIAEL